MKILIKQLKINEKLFIVKYFIKQSIELFNQNFSNN